MKQRLLNFMVIAGLLFFTLQMATPSPAYACTPPAGGLPELTMDDYAREVPVIAEATVTNVELGVNSLYEVATLEVTRYFKGSGPALIEVPGYGPGSVCLSSVSEGQTGLFMLDKNEGLFSAYYVSQFDAFKPATEENIAALEAQFTPVEPEPGGQSFIELDSSNEGSSWSSLATITAILAALCLCGVVPVGVGGFIFYRRRQAKPAGSIS